ncbi:MAG: ABC transporter substrate-binding protein [archaeon]
MKTLSIIVIVVICFLLIGAIGIISVNSNANFSAIQSEKEVIRVGGLFSLTGTTAFSGNPEARFAQLAIDEINQNGGINGKQIEFILEDDKCDAKEAITVATKLMEQDYVKFILGPSCSPATAAVAPITNEHKVVIIAASSVAKNIFQGKGYSFRASPEVTVPAQLQALQTINSKHLTKVAIISELSNFPKSWSDDFEEEYVQLGGKITKRIDFTSNETNFRTALQQISNSNPGGVFISTLGPAAAVQIIKQINELGLNDEVVLLGNHTSTDNAVNEGLGGLMPESMFTIVPYSSDANLLSKYVAKYGEEPSFEYFYTAAMYDAVYLLKDAITFCGEDTTCVENYLKNPNLNFKGQVAEWNFDLNGNPLFSKEVYRERRIVGGVKIYYLIN